jgi:hypothetical protein
MVGMGRFGMGRGMVSGMAAACSAAWPTACLAACRATRCLRYDRGLKGHAVAFLSARLGIIRMINLPLSAWPTVICPSAFHALTAFDVRGCDHPKTCAEVDNRVRATMPSGRASATFAR